MPDLAPLGSLIRGLLFLALTGIGALISLAMAAFGVSSVWLWVPPALGAAAGLAINAMLFSD